MTNSHATLHYLQGIINFDKYAAFARKLSISPDQLIFIFPSNPSHHTEHSTLYSLKQGGGLAKVAMILGEHGIPTLGLPTTGMPLVNDNDSIPPLARQAMADLWRAVGYGMHLVLPVREHTNTTYFSHALDDRVEPSFWGGMESTSNRKLGDYYQNELAKLQTFLTDPRSIQQLDPLFERSFLQGQHARKQSEQPAWYAKPPNPDHNNGCSIL